MTWSQREGAFSPLQIAVLRGTVVREATGFGFGAEDGFLAVTVGLGLAVGVGATADGTADGNGRL